jgi:peroxiredoxin
MNIGDIAPNFVLKNHLGEEFNLYKNLDKKILLVFYPEDDTPVCSSQLKEYNNHLDDFIKNEIKVVGINTNSIESHLNFCSKLKLKFSLLSDENKNVSKKYNALNIFGINKRLLVLIGKDRKVLWIKSSFSFKFVKSSSILTKVSQNYISKLT